LKDDDALWNFVWNSRDYIYVSRSGDMLTYEYHGVSFNEPDKLFLEVNRSGIKYLFLRFETSDGPFDGKKAIEIINRMSVNIGCQIIGYLLVSSDCLFWQEIVINGMTITEGRKKTW
jgi:hypothetical protein